MTNPDTSREAVERAAEELIEYLDQEAEIEIESAGHMTELGKQLRRLETTARILDNDRRALLAERDALQAKLAVAVDTLECLERGDDSPDGMAGDIARAALAALTSDTPKEGKDDDQ